LSDVAYAAYRFVPLHAPEADAVDSAGEMRRRLRLVLRSYRAAFTVGEQLEATVVACLGALRAFMYECAAAGDARFARHIAEGDADVYQRDAAFLDWHCGEQFSGENGTWRRATKRSRRWSPTRGGDQGLINSAPGM